MEKKFTIRDIAEFKRTARNVWPLQAKKVKLSAKIAELQAELDGIDSQIALKEAYVVGTTGYHVFDLMERKVTVTPSAKEDGTPKLDDKGKQLMVTTVDYILKYPETVVPVMAESVATSEIDDAEKVEEVETPAAEAPFDPTSL